MTTTLSALLLQLVLLVTVSVCLLPHHRALAFSPVSHQPWGIIRHRSTTRSSSDSRPLYAAAPSFRPIPPELEGIPIPFVDVKDQNFIECYADSVAVVDGVEYTIGVPCDYAVALCYFKDEDQLVPVELNDTLMDDIYPLAESILEEEFGDELVLQRTPQTLTLVGELEEEDDEEDDDFDDEDEDDDDDEDEEVEVLLAFEHNGRQYNLVRMLDPMLLVGKQDKDEPENRMLLSPEESDQVMPILETMFLERDDIKP
jgi:Protein of unknown function (DUF3727)